MTATSHAPTHLIDDSQVRQFQDDGYIVVRGLFTQDDVDRISAEFMTLQKGGPIPGHFDQKPDEPGAKPDPLRAFPRVIHPHQISELAREYLLDARLASVLRQLLDEEPLASQSMFYYKPPGARGQALHQDNFYLRVEPGTCVAAWVAIDDIDTENGGLEVVPGTHQMDIFCPEESDPEVSFTRDFVPPPPGLSPVPLTMAPGDVLFFNGSVVHGSGPNKTTDRFRRSFICHYVGESTQKIARFYDVLAMDGKPLVLAENTGGGPCGDEIDRGPH